MKYELPLYDTFPNFYLASIEAPVFSTQLSAVSAEAGTPLELTATINRFAEPVESTWQKDNKPVDTKAKGVRAACEKGQCTLKIDSCSLADAGEYTVTVKNQTGVDISSAKIAITGYFIIIKIYLLFKAMIVFHNANESVNFNFYNCQFANYQLRNLTLHEKRIPAKSVSMKKARKIRNFIHVRTP